MKKAKCGDVLGYMMTKEEFDNKLRERFSILKNKPINYVYRDMYADIYIHVIFGETPPEKIEEGVWLYSFKDTCLVNIQRLVVEQSLIKDLLGITSELVICRIDNLQDTGKNHLINKQWGFEFMIPDLKGYYFIVLGKPHYDCIEEEE